MITCELTGFQYKVLETTIIKTKLECLGTATTDLNKGAITTVYNTRIQGAILTNPDFGTQQDRYK